MNRRAVQADGLSLRASLRISFGEGGDRLIDLLVERELLEASSLLTIRDLTACVPRESVEMCAIVLSVLFAALFSGGICVQLANLRAAVIRYAGEEILPDFPEQQDLLKVLTPLLDPPGAAPLVFQSATGSLFFQKYHAAHSRIERALLALASFNPPPFADALVKAAVEKVTGAQSAPAGAGQFVLTPDQSTALAVALFSNPAVITGGPGTGKTSIIVILLRILLELGVKPERIRLTAPTGRAAQRIAESIEAGGDERLRLISTQTIHRLLGYKPRSHDFSYGPDLPLDADVIIVDESSMVDLILMSRLLASIDPARTRLVLLGDRDQLPSVEAGAVLSDLITPLLPGGMRPAYTDEFVRRVKSMFRVDLPVEKEPRRFVNRIAMLSTSHRSKDDVLLLARWINAPTGEPPLIPMDPAVDGWPSAGAGILSGSLHRPLKSWIAEILTPAFCADLASAAVLKPDDVDAKTKVGSIFRALHSRRILCVTREGRRGVTGLNRLCSGFFREQLLRLLPGAGRVEPILILRNDRERGLSNGDPGVIFPFTDGRARAVFSDGRVFPVEALPEFETAFAMTVHKSQGSEYEWVLFVLPEERDHPLLTRELLYTGVTRAKSLAAVSGTPEVLKAGAERKIERETGAFLSIL